MTAVGVASYRQMDDRKGTSLMADLRHAFTGSAGVYAATGCFVALEGGEGAGKSTQSRLLREWLEAEGYDVVLTREPGDTEVGQKLRQIVLDPATGDISHRTEALLYAADKAEHVDRVVAPALARGAVVVTDRYVDSTLAYQGAGRDLVDREVERVARWATDDLRPHLTVLLDLPPQQGLTRFEERDRIEAESVEFHERVREMFLQLAGRSRSTTSSSTPPAGRGDRRARSGTGSARCSTSGRRPARRGRAERRSPTRRTCLVDAGRPAARGRAAAGARSPARA